MSRTEEVAKYAVVINHEEQYSIWPIGRRLPRGWSEVGKTGTKEQCLAYIERVTGGRVEGNTRKDIERRL